MFIFSSNSFNYYNVKKYSNYICWTNNCGLLQYVYQESKWIIQFYGLHWANASCVLDFCHTVLFIHTTLSLSSHEVCTITYRAFSNHKDTILPLFDPPPTPSWQKWTGVLFLGLFNPNLLFHDGKDLVNKIQLIKNSHWENQSSL